jgi:hypothetical protein
LADLSGWDRAEARRRVAAIGDAARRGQPPRAASSRAVPRCAVRSTAVRIGRCRQGCRQGWWRRVVSSRRISSPTRPPPSGAVG